MTRMIRLLAVSAVALGLTACGGEKLGGDKEGAAQAAFQASQPAGRGHTKSGQALIDQALASGAVSITLSADCAESGKVHLTLNADATPWVMGALSYTIRYDACNEDGDNEYNGEVTTTMVAGFDLDGKIKFGAFYIAMKGKLTIEGEISDFIDTDVRLGMELTATSKRSGSVQLVVDGTIKTSTHSFTYSKEVIATTAGRLPRG
jgi:acetaldehyde dehydrogenase (acetylating)